jgi:UDP-glucose 4-epimerase
MTAKVLVTGGAGYIGSHVVLALVEAGYLVVVLDDLSTGHSDLLPDAVPLQIGGLSDQSTLNELFSLHEFDAVLHFAASAYVGESVGNPAKYYLNNMGSSLTLLEACKQWSVRKFIFSSSCATYGNPELVPIHEATPQNPVNPYGRTKLAVEWMIRDYAHAYDLRFGILRYFNVAGADPHLRSGERHDPEPHLIPRLLELAAGRREVVEVYGRDYDTRDGTCERDYVHVSDLARAHVQALDSLLLDDRDLIFNVGLGRGYTVKEIVDAVKQMTNRDLVIRYGPRRTGDPPVLVSDARKIRKELGWEPGFTEIDEILSTAWKWHNKDWKRK